MKNLRIFLMVICLTLGLTACNSDQVTNEVKEENQTEENNEDTITITDHTGEEVIIPANIERVVIDQVPLASAYVMYHGGADKLIGLSESVVDSIRGTELVNIAPEILEVSTEHNKGELSVEELLELKPDVILYNSDNEENKELFKELDIPAVGFTTGGDPVELYAEWLKLLGKTFQDEDKVKDVLEYGDKMISEVKKRTSEVSEEDRANAMILFNISENQLKASGANKHFGHFWLKNINVKNAAESIEGINEVNIEEVYNWDPDVIFIPGYAQGKIRSKDILENNIEGFDFSPLTAIKEGRVHSTQLGMWSWYTPNPDAPLVLTWLAKNSYPELFKDIDMKAETKKYYKDFYNYELDEENLNTIFDDN